MAASAMTPSATKQVVLDRVFASLGDPTRRAIIERLTREREVSVGELAGRFDASLPAIIKHINVLEEAGLVQKRRDGRRVHCSLVAGRMSEARAWLDRHLAFWSGSLDRLERVIAAEGKGLGGLQK